MNKIQELETKINQARTDYYNAASKVSDQLYDSWIDELSKLDPKNIAVTSIGTAPVSNWEKYQHRVPMGSLNKVNTHDEYNSWHQKYISKDDKAFISLKIDGLSVSLMYENGTFVRAATRGSGSSGELITQNVAKMQGVPLRLSEKVDLTVRSEIVMTKENHAKHFQTYSSPRNAASGISRRYDSEGSEYLTIISYTVSESSKEFKTFEDQFKYLAKLGFKIPPYYVLSSAKEVNELKTKYQESLREAYETQIDGLVCHLNNIEKHSALGALNLRDYGSVGIKFDSNAKEGTISDIVNQVGNSGRIVPVATFSPPIRLMDADIEHATLHNFGIVRDLGVGIGAKVLVIRSGDIIPSVLEVTEAPKEVFETPTNCPVCDHKLIEAGEYIQCPNKYGCKSQISGRLDNWISELNVLEWGSSLLEKLVETKLVTDVSDLYKLSLEQLASVDRMGAKSAKNCRAALWSNTNITLDVFVGGLSIALIGMSSVKLLMNAGYDTLDKLFAAKSVDFEKVRGMGPTRSMSLELGLKENKELIMKILDAGVKVKEVTTGTLGNKTFCFTGALKIKRAVLEKMVTEAGGIVKNGVNKDLHFLVTNEISDSSKSINAKKFGTTILTEEQLMAMMPQV